MPALQAISPWCLVMPQVPAITNLFGGSLPGEGMGLFSISADWALVGSYSPLYVPLDAQINEIFSFFVSIFLFMAAYRYNFFGSAPMPFISFQLFDSHGKPYDTKRAIFPNGTGNAEVIREIGTPSYSISVVLAKTMLCMGTSASITTAIAATWAVYRSPGKPKTEEIKKRDSTIKKTTGEFHWTGYLIIFLFSVALAIAASQLSGSGLSILGLLVALSVAGLLSLTAGYFYGTVGIPLMVARNALGNMWFTIYGSTSVMQSVSMLKDLKLGQYMQLTPVATVAAQLSGTFVGVIIHYAVMILLVSTQREALLLPYGNGIFSGVLPSIFAVEATAMAGNILTASAGRTVASVVGITSQFLMKKYRFGWFKKYNYILCAALDGGTQITVLLLGFILQGGAGFKVEFPT
ncbi:OPT oligopeptide transporter protein-domain-containing protein [Phakopsora pachyrhizi]|nr:OPT oligopeptide transporter protein-domain-containing protein [Phakopsora pachyrhizi]